MIITRDEQQVSHIVIRPTRSLSWRETRVVAAAIALITIGIGGYFFVQGLYLVLPFSGLEAIALAAAFYYVSWEGERAEVVTIEDDMIRVSQGRYSISSQVDLGLYWARVELRPSPHSLHPSRLWLRSEGCEVEIGRFLTEGERKELAHILIHAIRKKRLE
ncbi:MAG: DUF2244 domain-containing protein [Gammaproteobacteria bacterium]|nr:DUF2244 domain-containing protein [Gammaproteobacteria bacterium]